MSKFLSSNLFQRIITGIIGITIILMAIYYNEWTYFFLLLAILLFCLEEFYRLIRKTGIRPHSILGISYGIFIYSISFLIKVSYFLSSEIYILISFLVFLFPYLFFIIQLYRKSTTSFADLAFTFLGIIYIVVPFSLFHWITFLDHIYCFKIVMGIFFLIWANDIGAYFIGKAFGKRKLFERISPKKTWEGTIGGALLTFAIGFIISIYFKDISMLEWLIIAGIISICGTYGDLVASMLKRSIQIKDSGSLLKGHGGFLDRFDSLLLAIPFIFIFLFFWRFLILVLLFGIH